MTRRRYEWIRGGRGDSPVGYEDVSISMFQLEMIRIKKFELLL